MTIYSPAEIRRFAYDAGFRGRDLDIAVAIALAESGGNNVAYNPETAAGTAQGSGSRGLWQIYGTAHPQYNNDQAYDPAVNARAAFQVYREAGNRFTPWSTFNNGSYANILKSVTGGIMATTVSNATRRAGQAAVTLATATGKTGASVASALMPPQAITALENLNKIGTFFGDKEKKLNLAANLFFISGGGILFIVGVILLFWVGREQIAGAAGKVIKSVVE